MKPVLQALLLADHVYQDSRTGKKVIAGIFSAIRCFEMENKEEGDGAITRPMAVVEQAGSPYVYVNLTEVHKETTVLLRYVCLKTHEVLFESSEIKIKTESPLETVEAIVPVPRLPTEPGEYALELHCENELLGSYRVIVQKIEKLG